MVLDNFNEKQYTGADEGFFTGTYYVFRTNMKKNQEGNG